MSGAGGAIDGPAISGGGSARQAVLDALWGKLGTILAAERERLALWLPVLFAIGIGLYFALRREPPSWAAPAIAVLGVVLAVLGRKRIAAPLLGLALAAIGIGAGLAQWRTHTLAAPVLEKRWGPGELTGRVVAAEIQPEGLRVVLDRLKIAGLPPERTPEKLRLRLRGDPQLRPGERIALRAVLLPPPAPAAPGAYDFQRHAWFQQLGAVGYGLGTVDRIPDASEKTGGMALWLNAMRQAVVERVLAGIPGPAGSIAAALMTGEQGAIPPDILDAMRDSGLAHLLSVSGLHVGLVAAIVFVALRQLLAFIPFLALRYPIKKWAAVAAFLAITAYMLFVTPGVPTQRAWLMASIVLLAILIDRFAVSMRLVAWAAFAILAAAPESLLGPSFQMSFGAVVALIAAWEVARHRLAAWRAGGGHLARVGVALAAIGMTTLVAGIATAPYALYHFNRFAAYSLAANLIAVPLTSVWIMPWAVLAFLLMPFGLEAWALAPMGWGVEAIIAVARTVAGWGGAVALLPAMPIWGLVLATIGGVWLCLWRTRWRLFGIPAIAAGLVSIAFVRGPDILISDDGRLMAVRGADGVLQLSSSRAGGLKRETWLRRAGQSGEAAPTWPSTGVSDDGRLRCDSAGCVYTVPGHVVALARTESALAEDCLRASVLIAAVPVRGACPSPRLVIDRFAVWRDGGHAVWLDIDGGVRVQSVRADRGERPWVPPPPRPRSLAGQGTPW